MDPPLVPSAGPAPAAEDGGDAYDRYEYDPAPAEAAATPAAEAGAVHDDDDDAASPVEAAVPAANNSTNQFAEEVAAALYDRPLLGPSTENETEPADDDPDGYIDGPNNTTAAPAAAGTAAAPKLGAASAKKKAGKSKKSPPKPKLKLKRVSKTTFNFKSDVDAARCDSHQHGILHATKSFPSSGREEHAFAWIADGADDARIVDSVAALFTKHGFRASGMRFVPFSSKANWIARYPHADPHVECDEAGRISGAAPQWENASGVAAASRRASSAGRRKSSRGGRRSPPRLLSAGRLPNAERDELHVAIHEYFAWLHNELSAMETSQSGRRQVSVAGVSVPGLRSLIAKLEGTFKAVQVEKERKGKENAAVSAATAAVENDVTMDLAADGALPLPPMPPLPPVAGGAPPPPPKQQQQQQQQQQQHRQKIPFLEQALEAELQCMVADKVPEKSVSGDPASSKSPGVDAAERKASWRRLDFDSLFQKLVDFKAEKGHISPPVKHPELGRWVSELRLNKKTLQERGVEHEPEPEPEPEPEYEPEPAAVEEGDDDPTPGAATPGEGGETAPAAPPQIDDVVAKNPGNDAAVLTGSRVDRLESVGFAWSVMPARVTWEQRFEELRRFKEGSGRFPSNKEGSLGNWLKGQRKLYVKRDANFMALRCAKFEELGVPLRQRHYTALTWEDRYQQLVEFGRVNRHFKVPNPAPDNGDGREPLEDLSSDAADAKRFYKFVQKIHTEYRTLRRGVSSIMLTEERIQQLRDIGFDFSTKPDKTVPDLDWSTRIQQLEAFQSEMGHLRVDPNYDKYSNLGGWAVEMSERHQSWQEGREYLSPDRVEKFNQLNSMGFGFDVFPSRRGERTWEVSFDLLLLYRQETGSCRVPHHYKADFRLGSWVAVQRKEYKLMVEGKPSRMTHEHIQRLESIDFEWVARRGD